MFEARPGETLPDHRRFGVFWMNERAVAAAFQMSGAFNNVLVDVAPGQNAAAVMAEMNRLLGPFGGLLAYPRRDHPSATRLNDELRVMRGLSLVFPAVFLGIASFMTGAMLTRLVRLQREQIAQLKAFGYSSLQVGWHYLQFGLCVVVVGVVAGVLGGAWFGGNVVHQYRKFFQFPVLEFALDARAVGWAWAVSSGAAFLGVVGSVRQVIRLAPAEAMRPEAPAEFRASLLERFGLGHLASPALRMIFRNLERKPGQSLLTALGLALATAIPVVPGALRDGIDYLLNFQWDQAQRQDVTLSLLEVGSSGALSDLRHLPGVFSAEAFRAVPARVRFGHVSRKLAIVGISRDAVLNRALDHAGRPIALPSDGLLVSAKLAEVLGARLGDLLTLEIQEGARPQLDVPIRGLVTDYAGVGITMEIGALRALMREGGAVSGAYLRVDPGQASAFFERVKRAPKVAYMAMKRAVRISFQKTTAEMIGLIQGLYFGFSVVVASGVVYNSARIALSERSRELATLRVVGFTHREVVRLMVGELVLLTLVALPAGLVIGRGLARLIVETASTETVRLPLVLSSRTYATAVGIVVVSAVVSCALVSRRIRHLDLLGVLKSAE